MTWIARRRPEPAQKLLHRILTQYPENGLAIILDLAPAIGDPLGQLSAEWLRNHPIEPQHARQLENTLPGQTLALRELAVEVMRHAVRDSDLLDAEQHAGLLNNLANRLSDLGDSEAALKAAQEAVALRRKLADARPDAFTPDMAMSLDGFSKILIAQGRPTEAERMLHEAITLLSPLFLNSPNAFFSPIGALCRDYGKITGCAKNWLIRGLSRSSRRNQTGNSRLNLTSTATKGGT